MKRLYSQKVIAKVLGDIKSGRISPRKAYEKLKSLPYESLSFAKLDHHRRVRKNLPEAIYSPGKNLEQLTKIVKSMRSAGTPLILSRLDEKVYRKLKKRFSYLKYSKPGRIAYALPNTKTKKSKGLVAVVTAGTADIPVAEEAAVTLEVLSHRVDRVYDCGVAGIHRLIDNIHTLSKAKVVICVAGMEGALASVVAGIVEQPVIAVPTSVGYGASFKGIAPLLTMLNSCAQGIAIVNIDNGFGAACFASLVVGGGDR